MANRKKKCNPTKKSRITVWKKLCRAVRSMPKDLICALAGFVSRSITLKYQKHVEHRVRIKMKALHLY